MATLPATGRNTLIDVAKSFGPDGKVAILAELLNQVNEGLNYIEWKEGNLPTGHKAVVRTGLPTVYLRQFYRGVKPSKSGRAVVEDLCAMIEGRNEIDKDLADLNGNTDAFRLSEGLAFIEAMTQTWAQQLMYGDSSVDPTNSLGLTPRYNLLSAQVGTNIIDAGGTGSDNTSVWLVVWGENTVHGIYPKGSQAGLVQENLDVIDAFDENNDRFRAYAELWKWKCGLHVKDWRYAVRIANIDVSDLNGLTGTQASTAATYLPKLMAKAFQKIPSMGMGRACFLASRTVKGQMSVLAMDKSSGFMTFAEAGNQFGTMAPGYAAGQGTGITGANIAFQGVPIVTMDQLLLTEGRVV